MTFRGHKPKFHHNSVKNPTLILRSVFRIGIKARFLNVRYHHQPVHSNMQEERW